MERISAVASTDPNVTVMLVVGTLFMLIILMGIGGEMGRRGRSIKDR